MALRRGVGLSDRTGELPHPRPAHRRAGRTPDPHPMKAVGTTNIPLYAGLRVCPALSTERMMAILTDLTCSEPRGGGLLIRTFTRTRPHAVPQRTRVRLLAGPAKVAKRPTAMAGRGRRLSGATHIRRDTGVKESRATVKILAAGRHKGRLSLFAADDGADDVPAYSGWAFSNPWRPRSRHPRSDRLRGVHPGATGEPRQRPRRSATANQPTRVAMNCPGARVRTVQGSPRVSAF